ncbi:MAG: head GIN domain-containing protein [Chitinophagaceae bacterium]
MIKNYFFFLIVFILFGISCNFSGSERIQGSGNVTTEQRNISDASKIKCYGSFNVEIMPGSPASVKIEADQNLISYIITEENDGCLIIRPKNNVNLSSSNKIKITVTTNQLQEVQVAGSGDVTGAEKFSGADHLKLGIAGSGNISLEVNTPTIDANIAGSGNINLTGEAKDTKIEIAGNGDYKAENLKAENVDVNIAGSGNVKAFADATLKVNIVGSGDVYYAGSATVTQHIAGSGIIKHLP